MYNFSYTTVGRFICFTVLCNFLNSVDAVHATAILEVSMALVVWHLSSTLSLPVLQIWRKFVNMSSCCALPPKPHFQVENGGVWIGSILLSCRGLASLTVLGKQEFHFPHFSSNFHHLFLFSSNFPHFCPCFGPPGGRVTHPGKALAMPLLSHKFQTSCFPISQCYLFMFSLDHIPHSHPFIFAENL